MRARILMINIASTVLAATVGKHEELPRDQNIRLFDVEYDIEFPDFLNRPEVYINSLKNRKQWGGWRAEVYLKSSFSNLFMVGWLLFWFFHFVL